MNNTNQVRFFVTASQNPTTLDLQNMGDPKGYESLTLPVMIATELSKSGLTAIVEHRCAICNPCPISKMGGVIFAELFENGRRS